MLARLGFSIAITMEAEIMLIDEILAVGDIAFQKKCYDRLAELRKQGLTFLIVSHGIPCAACATAPSGSSAAT